MMVRLIKLMHDKIAGASVPLTGLGLLVLGLISFFGMVSYNQRSNFCLKCHVNRGPYQNIDLESVAHKPYVSKEKSCLDCHSDKDFHAWAKETAVAGGKYFRRFTNDLQQVSFEIRNVPDDRCLDCHHDVLKLKDADAIELSPRLARIGLNFDHKKHFDFKEFDAEQKSRWESLRAQSQLSQEQRDELDFLDRVRIGNCAQCHERNQPITPEGTERTMDRQINYFTTNPIRCSGCHTDAVTAVHPGPPLAPPLAMPDQQNCRRCHNGRLHGRLVTFPARCDANEKPDTEHCAKCHPNIGPNDRKSTETLDRAHLVMHQGD